MPDQKISQLTDGAPAQSGDQIPVNRSGTNVRITAGNIAALATTTPLTVPGTAGATGALRLAELTGNGTNYVALAAPSSIAADLTWTLPATDGTNGQALTTNGSGTLSWATASAAAGSLTGTTLASNVVSSSLTSVGTLASLAVTGAVTLNGDAIVTRDAANTLAQRNGTNAQTFRLYNTFTDASNYERGKLEWASNVLRIGTEKLGTGTARALELQTDGTTRVTVNTDGSTTFASHLNLPANCRFNVSGAPSITAIWGAAELRLAANYNLGWSINPGDATSPLDLALVKDAAWTLALRSGTNAQTFNIYNTFTSATNYERLSIAATAAGAVRIRTNKGSGGGTARALELGTDDTTRLTVKVEGQTRFIPLTADPANAEDGDVYYNSTTNKLRVRAGGAWVDLH